ncbi:MAG: sugar phosphate isomerase/epimerase, partial [Acidobacteriaceae bacterium]|nr:sugar phosphate isomerase/epimerase [Acidobacteriaceae bacterium]
MNTNQQFPKLHNAMWPGLVGKGPGAEPFIDLDTMLRLTAEASV